MQQNTGGFSELLEVGPPLQISDSIIFPDHVSIVVHAALLPQVRLVNVQRLQVRAVHNGVILSSVFLGRPLVILVIGDSGGWIGLLCGHCKGRLVS